MATVYITFTLYLQQLIINSIYIVLAINMASQVSLVVKKKPACQYRRHETWTISLGWEDALEEGMTTHSSILAWIIPWTEEPGGLQSMGSQRVRHE